MFFVADLVSFQSPHTDWKLLPSGSCCSSLRNFISSMDPECSLTPRDTAKTSQYALKDFTQGLGRKKKTKKQRNTVKHTHTYIHITLESAWNIRHLSKCVGQATPQILLDHSQLRELLTNYHITRTTTYSSLYFPTRESRQPLSDAPKKVYVEDLTTLPRVKITLYNFYSCFIEV